jgi:hypothetical protein
LWYAPTFQLPLSLRDIAKLLFQYGVIVSYNGFRLVRLGCRGLFSFQWSGTTQAGKHKALRRDRVHSTCCSRGGTWNRGKTFLKPVLRLNPFGPNEQPRGKIRRPPRKQRRRSGTPCRSGSAALKSRRGSNRLCRCTGSKAIVRCVDARPKRSHRVGRRKIRLRLKWRGRSRTKLSHPAWTRRP